MSMSRIIQIVRLGTHQEWDVLLTALHEDGHFSRIEIDVSANLVHVYPMDFKIYEGMREGGHRQ